MKSLFKILAISLLSATCGCGPSVNNTVKVDNTPKLWPDYVGVTIPCNIAPMNFSTIAYDSLQQIEVTVKTPDNKEFSYKGKNYINFPNDDWREILSASKGKQIELKVSEVKGNTEYDYAPFNIYVSDSEIDEYLSYRLIAPGYRIYSHIGLYCRNLTNFDESEVIDNKLVEGDCINCHSFPKGNADKAQIHIRGPLGCTVLKDGETITICNAKTDRTKLNCVYPYWHPSEKFIAYSQNNTVQEFHCGDPNRVEVYDKESGVVVYDVENNKLMTTDALFSPRTYTTEPSFSPDGNTLYYTSAKVVDTETQSDSIRYDICKIGFNPESKAFGDVDTLVKTSNDSCTAAFPRPSYDGKYLLYTRFKYGNFAIWHTEADLWMLNLSNNETYPLTEANSDNVDSYHTWSTNSRWIAFESRRDDGFYTRVYIAYIDDNGKATKAFMIPQENPEQNRERMLSYNVPEFSVKEFKVDLQQLNSKLRQDKLQFGW